jgi:DMSO/TMAO reductase YedYZ molybdopterin-dependent catalytic subunit
MSTSSTGWEFTRRAFLQFGTAAVAACGFPALAETPSPADPLLREAIDRLEYLTPLDRAIILDKGKAGVTKLPPEKLREIGLTPESWSLEVVPDAASTSVVEQPISRAQGNALTWDGLMKLSETRAIRFLHLCTCTNGQDPFHMSLWEGVPLRDVIALTRPKDNVRRVYYQSYHPETVPPFQASLAMSQVLEPPPGQMPPTLVYKMNGQFIPASHGGPVRMIVPGSYGSKSTKWVNRVVLTNDYKSNDSDAELNNDPENPMKTRARFIHPPKQIPAHKPAPIRGMAQIGLAGLRKVQVSVHSQKDPWPGDDPFRIKADWHDATLLPPPEHWGGGLPDGKLPPTAQTDPKTGKPIEWPLGFTIAHWAALLPPMAAGTYDLCCRTIDDNGAPQPLPRTLPRTGFNGLHIVTLMVG